jgi:hypothetical protein
MISAARCLSPSLLLQAPDIIKKARHQQFNQRRAKTRNMRQGTAEDVAHHPQEKTEGRLDVSLFVRSTLFSQRSPIIHTAVTFSCVMVLASDVHGNKQCEDGLSCKRNGGGEAKGADGGSIARLANRGTTK